MFQTNKLGMAGVFVWVNLFDNLFEWGLIG